jgi:antitoxin PrlF
MPITVTTRGRVTLPAWVRERLGVGPGSKIEFELVDDQHAALTDVSGTQPKKRSRDRSRKKA